MRAIRTRRAKAILGTMAIAAVVTACGPTVAQGPAPCDAPASPTHPASAAIFNQLNAERAGSGLAALSWNRQLYCLATDWSQQMAASGSLHHRDLNSVIRSSGYGSYRTLGENILRGPAGMTGLQMEAAWMASPDHRANILSGAYTSIGIGLALSPDGGTAYATQNFGG